MTFHNRDILEREKCLNCGRNMVQVKDTIQSQYTGHLWRCECMPKGAVISKG